MKIAQFFSSENFSLLNKYLIKLTKILYLIAFKNNLIFYYFPLLFCGHLLDSLHRVIFADCFILTQLGDYICNINFLRSITIPLGISKLKYYIYVIY